MSIFGVNEALVGAYQYADKTQKAATNETDFMEQLKKSGEMESSSKVESYQKYLEQKYGKVSIQNVGKDQKSIDNIGAGTAGTGNVVIAPNIMEEMASNPEKAAYYEGKIQNYFDSLPRYQAELSVMGHEIHSSGIVIHPDGTVTHYISGDLKPEVRAKIEAKMKAEDEAKAKRKRQYQERSEKAAEERKQQMELLYKKQSMMGFLANHTTDMSKFTYIGTPEIMSAAVAAYERNIM